MKTSLAALLIHSNSLLIQEKVCGEGKISTSAQA